MARLLKGESELAVFARPTDFVGVDAGSSTAGAGAGIPVRGPAGAGSSGDGEEKTSSSPTFASSGVSVSTLRRSDEGRAMRAVVTGNGLSVSRS